MTFHCSICEEESARICVCCTKDTCANHLCARCLECSDCCECEVPLEEHPPLITEQHLPRDPDPEPEPHTPAPDPDPAPIPDHEPAPVV